MEQPSEEFLDFDRCWRYSGEESETVSALMTLTVSSEGNRHPNKHVFTNRGGCDEGEFCETLG